MVINILHEIGFLCLTRYEIRTGRYHATLRYYFVRIIIILLIRIIRYCVYIGGMYIL